MAASARSGDVPTPRAARQLWQQRVKAAPRWSDVVEEESEAGPQEELERLRQPVADLQERVQQLEALTATLPIHDQLGDTGATGVAVAHEDAATQTSAREGSTSEKSRDDEASGDADAAQGAFNVYVDAPYSQLTSSPSTRTEPECRDDEVDSVDAHGLFNEYVHGDLSQHAGLHSPAASIDNDGTVADAHAQEEEVLHQSVSVHSDTEHDAESEDECSLADARSGAQLAETQNTGDSGHAPSEEAATDGATFTLVQRRRPSRAARRRRTQAASLDADVLEHVRANPVSNERAVVTVPRPPSPPPCATPGMS